MLSKVNGRDGAKPARPIRARSTSRFVRFSLHHWIYQMEWGRVRHLENGMWALLLGSVGIPFAAVALFAVLEGASTRLSVWEILLGASRDMCNVSIGIVGGIFGNAQLLNRLGSNAPVYGIGLEFLNIILCAIALLVSKRGSFIGLVTQAKICLFIGCFSIAIPSIMILWIGGFSWHTLF